MEKAKILEELIRKSGYNAKTFSEKCGMPYTTVYSILKNGVGKASVNNVMTICHYLGITVEQLDSLALSKLDINTIEPPLKDCYFNFAQKAQNKNIPETDLDMILEIWELTKQKEQ